MQMAVNVIPLLAHVMMCASQLAAKIVCQLIHHMGLIRLPVMLVALVTWSYNLALYPVVERFKIAVVH